MNETTLKTLEVFLNLIQDPEKHAKAVKDFKDRQAKLDETIANVCKVNVAFGLSDRRGDSGIRSNTIQ